MPGLGPGRRLPAVLIIDDDKISREVMATVLSMSGYTVHTAASGAQSLAMLETGTSTPELILMDTQMPGLSGAALIGQLRARTKAKLYAMSGSDAPREVTDGADGFLLKPLGPEALQRMLEQHATEVQLDTPGNLVVNPHTLAELRKMMAGSAVREIFVTLIADLRRRLPALRKAMAGGDAAEVRRLGHAIKGGCGLVGAERVAGIGERLEAERYQLDNGEAILRELHAATGELQRMLEAEFPSPGN